MLSCLTFLVLALSDRSWSRSALISASDIAVGPRLASLWAYVVLHMMPLNSDKAGWHWLGRGRLHSCIARRHPGRVHTQPTAGPAGPAAGLDEGDGREGGVEAELMWIELRSSNALINLESQFSTGTTVSSFLRLNTEVTQCKHR